MTHLWVRAETRPNEDRVGITPEGVAVLLADGFRVTVEEDATRVIPIADYAAAGAEIAMAGAWKDAPADAVIFGLKELPEGDTPLVHRHIMFGHAYKGQAGAKAFLSRFRAGGGVLLDLEYLSDDEGRRLAAFGHWAGFAGAALSVQAFAVQADGGTLGPVDRFPGPDALVQATTDKLAGRKPTVLIIGARGRVGGGAHDALRKIGLTATLWDMAETASGGPFPEILQHDIFLNCILAMPGVPLFVGPDDVGKSRALRVIGDIACDPTSDFSPVPVYDAPTSWGAPVRRVAEAPPLDVMAIDNLPSLLPREASIDFSQQVLPLLRSLGAESDGVWSRAEAIFRQHAGVPAT